ncbi:F-box/kelch-repeat protein At3g06240-like [Rhododendron vialii]|uniref:F-box/kelch-repeat protein At3g06240-like n=1 Tax=Rhododendron vialii TaxID=182163 RepID=UPI00265FDA5D|nr:F-box/kelch-repeat protein At3g06240-like [Rhododendron vialii]
MEHTNFHPKYKRNGVKVIRLLDEEPLCSCDGLILVHVHDGIDVDGARSGESFILWNPANGSHRRTSCPYELPITSLYGLCYDSAADDYRVFIVSHDKVTSVAVYSLRNNSWDIFVDNRYGLYVSVYRAVVNGAVHWVMFSMESGLWVIVYFDLVEGQFKEVPPPSSWKEDDVMNLVVLGGFLRVYCEIREKQIEVYAMKEYGKKESWARLFVIPSPSESKCSWVHTVPSSAYVKLLCLTKKGQVLISMGTRGRRYSFTVSRGLDADSICGESSSPE